MPNHGGRYEIRDGKRVLVERTQPAPETRTRAPATTQADPKPAAKPAPKKSSTDVKEQNDG